MFLWKVILVVCDVVYIHNCFIKAKTTMTLLLGNNRKLHYGLTISVNYKIVHFEDLNKQLQKNAT